MGNRWIVRIIANSVALAKAGPAALLHGAAVERTSGVPAFAGTTGVFVGRVGEG